MTKTIISALGAAALMIGAGVGSAAAESVIVVDRPDVQALSAAQPGARIRDLIGMEVYSNAGVHLGEIEDFLLTDSGFLYAVVDTDDGPLGGLIEWPDGEKGNVVVAWDQLRVADTAMLPKR